MPDDEMAADRARRAWNAIADQYNQWDALGQDERDALILKEDPGTDIQVTNHGAFFDFEILTDKAQDWVEDNVDCPMAYDGGVFVDQRYAHDLAAEMLAAGLRVK